MRSKLSAVSQASLLAVLASGSALGQQAQPQTTPAESKLEEIVVTGTRILRKDDSSSSPVVTVGVDAIRETGSVTVENYLNTMPQFAEGSSAGTISIGGGLG